MAVVINVFLVVVLRKAYRLERYFVLVIGNCTIRLLLIFLLHRVRLPLLMVRHYIQMEIFPYLLFFIIAGCLQLTAEAILAWSDLK